jgi:2-polyprenyl-3-methyl-5-hydroxy-6-metoxy-1,4-benzoquinol methylase
MMLVKFADFKTDWLKQRAAEMHEEVRPHRKLWEFCAIAENASRLAPDHFGALRVLGFGVGQEPLPAWFAEQGSKVVATDAPHDNGLWEQSGQLAKNREAVYRSWSIKFEDNVAFSQFDMNDAPGNFRDFDITYSAGSLEHIGGIEKSLQFFCNQMKCLKPRGIALHTTEFTHGPRSLNAHNLCVFHKRHLKDLTDRLWDQGDYLRYDLTRGTDPEDALIDEPPYTSLPHLSLRIAGVVTTSILLIGIRGY